MNFFKELELGKLGYNMLTEQRRLAEARWEKTGLLKGLDKGHIRQVISQLYENQREHMLRKKHIYESTDTQDSNGQFTTVAFPIIRRVFSKLLANELVSVHSLNLPIGRLYFMNPKISTRRTVSGAQGHYEPDGAYENAAFTTTPTEFESRSMYDAYYAGKRNFGSALFDRTKGRYTETAAVIGTAPTVSGDTIVTSTSWEVTLTGFSVTNQGKLVGAQGIPIDTEVFFSSLKVYADVDLVATGITTNNIAAGEQIPANAKVVKYANAMAEDGQVVIVIDLGYYDNTGTYVGYTVATAPELSFSYRVYTDLEEDSEMAEITFEMKEIEVAVTTRKLRANWTPELAQDVNAFHNIDAEAELTALMSETIAAEIDLEILRDLYAEAAWYDTWDSQGYKRTSTTYYGVQKDYNQELITKINQISAQIHKSTLRGGAGWVVVSTEVSAIMDNLEYFHANDASPEQDEYSLGIEKVGTLNSRYKVFRAPYLPADTLIIGKKGKSILETGYVWATYVPIMLTPVLNNPFDFTNIRGCATRYAKKMVMNRYYGRIRVENVRYFDLVF